MDSMASLKNDIETILNELRKGTSNCQNSWKNMNDID